MLTTLLDQVARHGHRTVISDTAGEYTAQQVCAAAIAIAQDLEPLGITPGDRIAVLASPGLDYVASMFAVWMHRAVFVPLCPDHPAAEVEYVLDDSGAAVLLVDPIHTGQAASLRTAAAVIDVDAHRIGRQHAEAGTHWSADHPAADDAALMLYTSGTTGRPKGVLHSHRTIAAQITCLVEAWGWVPEDRIVHFLPLHHLHGLVNQLLCPLWVGARCDMIPRFDARTVLDMLSSGAYTIFMAVPTVYARLIDAWSAADPGTQRRWSSGCHAMRVMLSGSAALPVPVLERWREISGHTLLERYGMTEIGIALSNPLHGERRPGFVGRPVPGMQVRIVNDGHIVSDGERNDDSEPVAGELEVRGDNIFVGYWGRPEETAASFSADGWFRTGDRVSLHLGSFRIEGRLSTDIIKSGGYKISALEIESVLAGHPEIAECSVVGIADVVWGERIAAAVVLRPGASLGLDELRSWAREHLAAYKLPTLLHITDTLPRNVMGKVLKPQTRLLFDSGTADTGAAYTGPDGESSG